MPFHELFGDISDTDADGEPLSAVGDDWRALAEQAAARVCEHPQINGLRFVADAVPESVAERLLPRLRTMFDLTTGANQSMAFGELPTFVGPLLPIAHALLPPGLSKREPAFDQMIANHYHRGEGIVPHVDLARFEDGVVIFSFQSAAVMDFARGNTWIQVLLEPGSCVCLSGEARYEWTHGIAERDQDIVERDGRTIERGERISVTLRRLKPARDGSGAGIGR
ncbi:hypothetical protein HDU82_005253 [Entophlyctis luteolus]|nr:hypothetical protein HDU82_005253 [Entophlyctis luteolus]